MIKNVIFWLEYPLFHVSSLIKSFSEASDLNVIVVCDSVIPQWRLDMGFLTPDFGRVIIYIDPADSIKKKLNLEYSNKDSVHIFHGLRGVKGNYEAFEKLKHESCFIGLYFEPSVFHGSLKAFLRKYLYKYFIFKIKSKIDFMLALGDLGRNQYVGLGLDENSTYPFSYFIADESISDFVTPGDNLDFLSKKYKILFVGQLIPTKNIPILINAVKILIYKGFNIELNIVGSGYLKDDFLNLVESLNIQSRVNFLGVFQSSDLENIFLDNDIFVLPSHADGWGMVAVEAMARGLPVVVSDKCGAGSIIKDKCHGAIVEYSSVVSLVKALEAIMVEPEYYFSCENTNKRLSYVRNYLSATAGAKELSEIINKLN